MAAATSQGNVQQDMALICMPVEPLARRMLIPKSSVVQLQNRGLVELWELETGPTYVFVSHVPTDVQVQTLHSALPRFLQIVIEKKYPGESLGQTAPHSTHVSNKRPLPSTASNDSSAGKKMRAGSTMICLPGLTLEHRMLIPESAAQLLEEAGFAVAVGTDTGPAIRFLDSVDFPAQVRCLHAVLPPNLQKVIRKKYKDEFANSFRPNTPDDAMMDVEGGARDLFGGQFFAGMLDAELRCMMGEGVVSLGLSSHARSDDIEQRAFEHALVESACECAWHSYCECLSPLTMPSDFEAHREQFIEDNFYKIRNDVLATLRR